MIRVIYFDKKFNKERCFAYSDGLMHLAENMKKHLELNGIECRVEHIANVAKRYDYPDKEKLISSVPKLGVVKVSNSQMQNNAAGQENQNNIKQVVMVKDASGNVVPRKRGRPPKNQVIVK